MTARELYEYALTELNKLEAPSLLLEDYNYFINKAVQQYLNLVYAKLELDQQSTDDIRVLKASTVLNPIKCSETYNSNDGFTNGLFKTSYYVDLPEDYLHLLNCVIEYNVKKANFKCYNKGDSVYFAARRLTSDMYTQILNNAYLRPMYKRPYYYLNNINTSSTIVTNSEMDDAIMEYNTGESGEPTGENWNSETESYVESNLVDSQNTAGDRLANPSIVRLELRFGNDDTVFEPSHVYVDYIKAPMYIRLTQEQIDSTLDFSQVLEFPDYVCFEIVNIFTRLLMENASDPRLQTNMPINQTIYNPAIQQAAQTNKK